MLHNYESFSRSALIYIWGPHEQAALEDSQAAIMESMKLAFLDQVKWIRVLMDASDCFHAGLVTQCSAARTNVFGKVMSTITVD
jgi:hypothetical protein